MLFRRPSQGGRGPDLGPPEDHAAGTRAARGLRVTRVAACPGSGVSRSTRKSD